MWVPCCLHLQQCFTISSVFSGFGLLQWLLGDGAIIGSQNSGSTPTMIETLGGLPKERCMVNHEYVEAVMNWHIPFCAQVIDYLIRGILVILLEANDIDIDF